ncbi:uncharacterized protein N7483_005506 [Penicillium malachiteum]|uniref:uncharacterized protein n=1 Tax=Penicillium malachiteum TaxID=1324776 RepID=UPI002546B3C0|nr:uncharacterized protein N7483_005506 [Penicillium malachiteum]KAJ5730998.1 hypothetical protein N7483_005506 [Penicillium malachiteum]
MSANGGYDSDEDVEFEDVPLSTLSTSTRTQAPESAESPEAAHNASSYYGLDASRYHWTPPLNLPGQRSAPLPSGSYGENQIRGQLNAGLERIDLRLMKARLGIDVTTLPTETRYHDFAEFSTEVERFVDILWISATPSIQIEGLLALAGITEQAIPVFEFDPEAVMTILHKFDVIFVALCTGQHPTTQEPLPGVVAGQPIVTQTQQVRMRSLAEETRSAVFLAFSLNDSDNSDEEEGNVNQSVLMPLTYIYEKTLTSLPT